MARRNPTRPNQEAKKEVSQTNTFVSILNWGALLSIFGLPFGIKELNMKDPFLMGALFVAITYVIATWGIPIYKRTFNNFYRALLLCFLLVIIGFYLFNVGEYLYSVYKKPETTKVEFSGGFKKDVTLPGILLSSDQLKSLNDVLYFGCGSFSQGYSLLKLLNGIDYDADMFHCTAGVWSEPALNIKYKLVYNRIVVTAIIKDLNGNVAAEIKDNQLTILGPYVLDWNPIPNDKGFEIIDGGNHVVLRLQLIDANNIDIKGYFVNNHTISVVNDFGLHCFDREDSVNKAKALDEIDKIARTN